MSGSVRHERSPRLNRELVTTYAIVPVLMAYFGLRHFYPTLFAFFVSFNKYDLLTGAFSFVGIDNYIDTFTDQRSMRSIANTSIYVVGDTLLGLFFALLLDRMGKGSVVLRTIYFMPVVVSVVALSQLWIWIYHRDLGLLNWALSLVGIGKVGWLVDTRYALSSIIIMNVWREMGFALVIFLAGLNTIPEHFYDAARVDGASAWVVAVIYITPFYWMIVSAIKPQSEMFTLILVTMIIPLRFRSLLLGPPEIRPGYQTQEQHRRCHAPQGKPPRGPASERAGLLPQQTTDTLGEWTLALRPEAGGYPVAHHSSLFVRRDEAEGDTRFRNGNDMSSTLRTNRSSLAYRHAQVGVEAQQRRPGGGGVLAQAPGDAWSAALLPAVLPVGARRSRRLDGAYAPEVQAVGAVLQGAALRSAGGDDAAHAGAVRPDAHLVAGVQHGTTRGSACRGLADGCGGQAHPGSIRRQSALPALVVEAVLPAPPQ